MRIIIYKVFFPSISVWRTKVYINTRRIVHNYVIIMRIRIFSSYSDAAKHRPKYDDGGGQLAVR